MKNSVFKKSLWTTIGLAVILSSPVYAAGYKMEFQSASVLADAGDAAVVEDAGTNWFNSAGLVYLPQQVVGGLFDVYVPTRFAGSSAAPSIFGPAFSFSGSGSARSNPNNIIPLFHYSMPLSKQVALGLSVVPAWGFRQDYGNDTVLRYDLQSVYTRSIDIAPSIAYKFNDNWSFGIGPDINYFYLSSRNMVRTQGPAPLGTTGDSLSRYSTEDWAYGAHAGILLRLNEGHTRIGLNYRSKIVMHLSGYSDFALDDGPAFENGNFKIVFPLPPTTSLSIYQDINDKWAVMGTLAYDQWSVVKLFHAKNFMQPTGPIPDVVLMERFSNTVDIGVGAHYIINPLWMLRFNMKYEPTPTNNKFRDVSFPDGDKLGVQIGTRFQMTSKIALDALVGHVFVRSVPINVTLPVTGVTVNGRSSTSINVFGAQVVWDV